MIAILRFTFSAYRAGVAYIDMDGCVLKKFPIPSYVPKYEALSWWKEYLQPTEVIYSRIALLYVLRALGVRLIVWTNRAPKHRVVTWRALGRHLNLFSELRLCDGRKEHVPLNGPVMDDNPRYAALGVGYSLLVESR